MCMEVKVIGKKVIYFHIWYNGIGIVVSNVIYMVVLQDTRLTLENRIMKRNKK